MNFPPRVMHFSAIHCTSSTDNTSPILPPEWLHQGGVAYSFYYIHIRHANRMYMLVHVFSCLIFPHSHTTIMLLGGNIGLVLSVGIVVCS